MMGNRRTPLPRVTHFLDFREGKGARDMLCGAEWNPIRSREVKRLEKAGVKFHDGTGVTDIFEDCNCEECRTIAEDLGGAPDPKMARARDLAETEQNEATRDARIKKDGPADDQRSMTEGLPPVPGSRRKSTSKKKGKTK